MGDKDRADLNDVIREERSRGRRPISAEAQRRRRQLLQDFADMLKHGTEEDFLEAIRALGLKDGSPQFQEALETWRQIYGL